MLTIVLPTATAILATFAILCGIFFNRTTGLIRACEITLLCTLVICFGIYISDLLEKSAIISAV